MFMKKNKRYNIVRVFYIEISQQRKSLKKISLIDDAKNKKLILNNCRTKMLLIFDIYTNIETTKQYYVTKILRFE